ncbi:MAG: carbohydrate ABC transporter permease [Thermomicrobiales bacterium]
MAIAHPRRSPWSPIRRRESVAGWLFVMPWVLGLLIFTTYPVIYSVYLSFTEYSVIQSPSWIGLDNYRQMFTSDPAFTLSVKNSLYYAIFSVPIRLISALILAMILNMAVRGIGLYRTIFYLPTLAPPVAGAITFILLFDPSSGLINQALEFVGLPTVGWLTDPAWSKPAMIILSLWSVGIETLIFLAGLKEIPQDLLDAASVDGASHWSKFRNIIFPLLSPVILFNLVMGVITSFQVFTQALVIGGTTGEPVESTLMYMVMLYRYAFRYFSMGYASALSVVLFVAVSIVTLVIFRTARFWVYYEGGTE